MTRMLFTIAVATLALAPVPAAAAHWVSMGRGEWIDTESIRRAGEVTYFRSAWYAEGYIPAGLTEPLWEDSAYNCRTNRLYNAEQGPDAAGTTLRGSEAEPFRRLLCR